MAGTFTTMCMSILWTQFPTIETGPSGLIYTYSSIINKLARPRRIRTCTPLFLSFFEAAVADIAAFRHLNTVLRLFSQDVLLHCRTKTSQQLFRDHDDSHVHVASSPEASLNARWRCHHDVSSGHGNVACIPPSSICASEESLAAPCLSLLCPLLASSCRLDPHIHSTVLQGLAGLLTISALLYRSRDHTTSVPLSPTYGVPIRQPWLLALVLLQLRKLIRR